MPRRVETKCADQLIIKDSDQLLSKRMQLSNDGDLVEPDKTLDLDQLIRWSSPAELSADEDRLVMRVINYEHYKNRLIRLRLYRLYCLVAVVVNTLTLIETSGHSMSALMLSSLLLYFWGYIENDWGYTGDSFWYGHSVATNREWLQKEAENMDLTSARDYSIDHLCQVVHEHINWQQAEREKAKQAAKKQE
jgi:hypothetical protein